MITKRLWLTLGIILATAFAPGCDQLGVPPPNDPSIIAFFASHRVCLVGDTVWFALRASSSYGLARGILDYRDGAGNDTIALSGMNDWAETTHVFRATGVYRARLTVEDLSGGKAVAFSDSLTVLLHYPPQIIGTLMGSEGSVSRVAVRSVVSDPEGDLLSVTVAPQSDGLVFRLNAQKDSIVYSCTDPDANGTKKGKITAVDQNGLSVERIVDIVFQPRDDISGRVRDRFEGTYLDSYQPAAVIRGPFIGWVEAITNADAVRVPVQPDGTYRLPKLASIDHVIRAWLTNGSDSSFVARYKLSPGDQTFDIGVETNAGTGMTLDRLLAMYRIVNFRSIEGMGRSGWLTGIDLRLTAGQYVYYLMGRDTATAWFNAKRFTPEQQDWFENEIQARCFAHLPPTHRPRIVKGGPNDRLPVTGSGPGMSPTFGTVIVYASLIRQVTDGQLTIWNEFNLRGISCARIALNGGDEPVPPYGFTIHTLVRLVGSSIAGNGVLRDPYYNDKSTSAESSTLDAPSIADMKLQWQMVFERPGFDNDIEGKYFTLPN